MGGKKILYFSEATDEAWINVEADYSIASDDKAFGNCPDYTGFSNAVVNLVVQASSGAALRNDFWKNKYIKKRRKYAVQENTGKHELNRGRRLKWCHTVFKSNTGYSNKGRDPRIRLIKEYIMMARG